MERHKALNILRMFKNGYPVGAVRAHMLDDCAVELLHEVDGLLCRMAYQDDMDYNRRKQY